MAGKQLQSAYPTGRITSRRAGGRDGAITKALFGSEQRLRAAEVDRDQSADALLDHRHAEQAVHAAHRHRIVGDDQVARVGLARSSGRAGRRSARYWRRRAAHRLRRARRSAPDWSGTGRRSARPRSAPARRPTAGSAVDRRLPGGWAMISRPGLERIVAFDQLEMRLPAVEQGREQAAEMARRPPRRRRAAARGLRG